MVLLFGHTRGKKSLTGVFAKWNLTEERGMRAGHEDVNPDSECENRDGAPTSGFGIRPAYLWI